MEQDCSGAEGEVGEDDEDEDECLVSEGTVDPKINRRFAVAQRARWARVGGGKEDGLSSLAAHIGVFQRSAIAAISFALAAYISCVHGSVGFFLMHNSNRL